MLFCQIVKKICAIKVATTTPPLKFSIDYGGTGRYEKTEKTVDGDFGDSSTTNKQKNKTKYQYFITLPDASVKTNQPKIVINKMLNVTVDSKN